LFQLQIDDCHRDNIETLHELLDATSALSVTLTDKHDDPILEPELGTTPLWPEVTINALYQEEDEAHLAVQVLSSHFPELCYSINLLPEQDWERVCLDNFKPQQFGKRLWICPSWLTPPDPNAVNLILDPGLAFGTGTHPTTSLCLTWLEQADLTDKTVIDYGCGSGILALAALKLGALHVNAVDIDEQALLATRSNAKVNNLSLTALTVESPQNLKTPVDLLIANILLTPLINLRKRFNELLKSEGTLVISGILENQGEELINIYSDTFTYKSSFKQENWVLLEFSNKN
jgi:ribosomal protein L11 methyltransferase